MTVGALLEQAFAHHEAGRLEQAETLYRNLLAEDEDNLNALQLLGAIAIDRRRHDEAVVWLDRAAGVLQAHGTATAQHAALYHNLGNALAALGRHAETVASYRRGLALDPDMPELSARLGAALAQQGDLPGAAAEYATALKLRPDHAGWSLDLGNIKLAQGEPEAALELYRQALAHEPGDAEALRATGLVLLSLQRAAEAIEPLLQLVISRPDDPAVHRLLGRAYLEAQQWPEAAAHFERARMLRPDDAETHWMIGGLAQAQRDFDAAEAAFRHALALAPEFPGVLFDLGTLLYREREQPGEAIALFRRLLAVEPDHVGVHCALGNAFRVQGSHSLALVSYQRYAALLPNSPLAHLRLGQAFIDVGQIELGLAHVAQSLECDGGHNLRYLAHVVLGNTLVKLQRGTEAQAHFRAALQLEPLATNRAAKDKADFAALLVLAPSSYNTPYEYLVDRTGFDSHVLLLLPDQDYDAVFLAAHADVVVNLVSDIDQDNAMLPVAAALIDRIGKPVINHPDRIRSTDRVTIAALLSGIPSCRVAQVTRHTGASLLDPMYFVRYADRMPFLLRAAGRHGGDDFERIETADDLQQLVLRDPEADYFMIDYIDYRSADGYYRKYRFFVLGDAVLPYHLAIGSDWKVHHFSTDMANQPWMRREEEAFIRDPHAVFEQRHFAALRAIRDAIGLEFFGVDCSLDRDGNLVVFEANATMLIHADTGDFAYKTPYVRQIKAAFGAMLGRAAAKDTNSQG